MENKMDKQRIYDAMLIKAFRADTNMQTLRVWLKPYDIEITDGTYDRCPEFRYLKLRVQVMVGEHMRKLSDRIWDTEKCDDIKTLNWMSDIKFSKKSLKTVLEIQSIKRKNNNDRKAAGVFGSARAKEGRNNQWGITK